MESVSLELHNDNLAGGDEIFIEIIQGSKSCQVKKATRIDKGKTKTWNNQIDLGTCFSATFDISTNNITFKLKTTHGNFLWSNDFKPKMVTIIIGNAIFKSEEINDWVDMTKGSSPRIAKKIGKKFSLTLP